MDPPPSRGEVSVKKLKIEVIGTEPPCARCTLTKENAEKAASKLRESGVELNVTKLSIMSHETVKRYGTLVSPAVAVNGVVKVMGRVPEVGEIERILRKAVEK
jgi:hypothetical protein